MNNCLTSTTHGHQQVLFSCLRCSARPLLQLPSVAACFWVYLPSVFHCPFVQCPVSFTVFSWIWRVLQFCTLYASRFIQLLQMAVTSSNTLSYTAYTMRLPPVYFQIIWFSVLYLKLLQKASGSLGEQA